MIQQSHSQIISDRKKSPANIERTRFLPLIFLCLSVSMTLSPLMMSLWNTANSGNANFPFFQGLVLWVFYALGIIEFANQAVREVDVL